MFRKQGWRPLVLALVACLIFATSTEGKPPKFGSSKSSKPRSSFGGSSKPKFGGSGSSKPKSKFGGSGSSKPKSKFGGSGSSKPKSSSPKSKPPSNFSGKPKFGSSSGSTKPKPRSPQTSPSKPKFSGGNSTLPRPPTSKKPSSSKKPQSSGSSMARQNRMEASRDKYINQKKTKQPSYVSSNGKHVKIRDNSATRNIRSRPSAYHSPTTRRSRMENHHQHYHYHHPHNWYYTQPRVYVGGGYSSAFWYMMMEWDYQRRARWLYHNQNNIESDAYRRGMQDARVAAEIARLEAQNVARQGDYIDPEFIDNPSDMYTQEYVDAAYKPMGHRPNLGWLWTTILVVVILVCGFLFVTKVRFGS